LKHIDALRYPRRNIQLLVVDNGSNDGSQKAIREFLRRRGRGYLEARIIELPRNVGAPAAMNRALDQLRKAVEFVWKLDNDVEPGPGSLGALVSEMTKTNDRRIVGAVSRLLHGGAGKEEPVGAVLLSPPRLWTRMLDYVSYEEFMKRNPTKGLAMMSGGCCLFRREVFERCGYFDERFFLYFDDTEFCLRLHKRGLRFVPVADEFVIHHGSASTSSVPSVRLYYWVRNHLLLGSCYFEGIERYVFFGFQVILLPWKYVRILLALGGNNRLIGTRYFVRGIMDFLRGRYGESPAELRPTWL
jgi:GT2 family glycosyltransferase